jgi:hypothetical protein
MTIKNTKLPIQFKTYGSNLDTIEPVWNIEIFLGGLKIQEYKHFGKSEVKAIREAQLYLIDCFSN